MAGLNPVILKLWEAVHKLKIKILESDSSKHQRLLNIYGKSNMPIIKPIYQYPSNFISTENSFGRKQAFIKRGFLAFSSKVHLTSEEQKSPVRLFINITIPNFISPFLIFLILNAVIYSSKRIIINNTSLSWRYGTEADQKHSPIHLCRLWAHCFVHQNRTENIFPVALLAD